MQWFVVNKEYQQS